MNHSLHSMVLSHVKNVEDRPRPAFMLTPSSKSNADNPGNGPFGEQQQSIHRAHHSTMFLASHSFRPFESYQSSRAARSSNDRNRVDIPSARSQSIPGTVATPTHSSIRKPLSGSFTFLPTPPPTNPRSAPFPRVLAARHVFSPSTQNNQRPKFFTPFHEILGENSHPLPPLLDH
jgi:hypothetical protein